MDPAAVRALIERERERLEGSGALAEGIAAWAALAEQHRRAGRLDAAEALAREALSAAPNALTSWMALCLALLEQGRIAEARDELARGLAGSPAVIEAQERIMAWPAAVAIAALPDDDALVDESVLADDEAEAFTLDDEPEALIAFVDEDDEDAGTDDDEDAGFGDDEDAGATTDEDVDAQSLLLDGRGTFATHTVATLLEQQGLSDEARRLRARLSDAAARANLDAVGVASNATAPARRYAAEADAITDSEVRAAWRARVLSTLEQWLGNIRKGAA